MVDGSDPNWKVEDYFVDFPDIAWPGGELVDMPLELKIRKVDEHLMNVLREATRCLAIEAELGAAMLGLAAIDYLAGFRYGRKSTGADFQNFLTDYFPSVYAEHSAWIYQQLRCGLMHNLTAINPWKGDPKPFHISGKGKAHLNVENGMLVFQLHVFLIDIYRAWVMYQHYLVMKANRAGNEVRAFHRRFDRLGGIASLMAKE